jgi:hypothetical protein
MREDNIHSYCLKQIIYCGTDGRFAQMTGFSIRHLMFPEKWYSQLVHTHMDSRFQFHNLNCHVSFSLVPLPLLTVMASYQC